MGYHAIVLPGTYSQGSAFGIGFDTRITTLESGQEARVLRYGVESGRRKYALNRGNMDIAMFQQLYKFFINRQGAAFSFKMLDPLDFASTSHGTAGWGLGPEPTAVDQVCTQLSSDQYQLVKRYYDDGFHDIVRTITKPVSGTVTVAVDGVTLPSGLYTVNHETGIITTSAGYTSQVISAGFQFYTVVRFSDETDKALRTSALSTVNTIDLPNIELIEDIYPSPVSQDYQFGGANTTITLAGGQGYTLSELEGRVQTFLINGAGTRLYLPSPHNHPLGGPIFVIDNISGVYLTTLYDINEVAIDTIAAGTSKMIFIAASSNAASRRWVVV